MTDAAALLTKLDELAAKMLDDAQKEGVSLPHRLDVFKICSQHYVNVAKVRSRGSDGDDNTPTMDAFRNRVASGPEDEDEPTSSSE